MPNVVLLFPGQGSQAPGMGKDLVEAHTAARDVFAAADEAIGAPLTQLCFEGPTDELTRTHNAQPALLTHGAAVWAVVKDAIGSKVVAAAGHSLGEFTAYHASGSLSLPSAVRLVRRRGELMYEAGVKRPGAMAAILGELQAPIESICTAAASHGLAVPANFNCPGQIVISGEEAGVERAMILCKEAGAKRAIRLNVSGAFHSPLMLEAAEGLREAIGFAGAVDANFPIYANVNAEAVTSSTVASSLLVQQLTAPVQWIRVVEALAQEHPEALYVEMGPGSVLRGLVKKINPALQFLTCGTAAEVDALIAQVG